MKKIISVLFLSLSIFINHTYANNPTNTMRTPSGQLVSIGDNYQSLITKIQQSPVSTRSYELENKGEKYTIFEYIYLIENSYYTVNVKNNVVESISWSSK